MMDIGIIGGGWYGCHVAVALSKKGHKVTLFEKSSDVFQGVSGDFGQRLHKGPHYPRSFETRESCRRSHNEFLERYPELVVKHEYSTYALGITDSIGNPPDKFALKMKVARNLTCLAQDTNTCSMCLILKNQQLLLEKD